LTFVFGLAVLALLPAQASAQLPLAVTTPPPPSHRADPALTTYVYRVGPFSIDG
jgi:hypothetical protein